MALWLLASGCGEPGASQIAGKYSRSTPEFTETLSVKADGSFEQVITYTNSQTISLTNSWKRQYKQIVFNRLYVTYDVERGATLTPPQLRYAVNMSWEPDVLVVNADIANRSYLFRQLNSRR